MSSRHSRRRTPAIQALARTPRSTEQEKQQLLVETGIDLKQLTKWGTVEKKFPGKL